MAIELFRTRIDNLSKSDTLRKVITCLRGTTSCQIATVNAEFLLEASRNKQFRDVLNACEMTVVDAFSLHLAFWRRGQLLRARYPGSDVIWDLLALAQRNHLSVYLVANRDGLSTWQETADAIMRIMPDVSLRGTNLDVEVSVSQEILSDMYGCAMVFCNFGAPYQEIFLHDVKNATIPSIRVVMGVGGSFDFMTGKLPRAPRWMRAVGLEWLYRLIKQPWRWKRIMRATIIFPLKVLFAKV